MPRGEAYLGGLKKDETIGKASEKVTGMDQMRNGTGTARHSSK